MAEEDTKKLWASKTLVGVIVAWLGTKLKVAGLDIPDETLKAITDIMIEGGILLAGLGRLVASQKLK